MDLKAELSFQLISNSPIFFERVTQNLACFPDFARKSYKNSKNFWKVAYYLSSKIKMIMFFSFSKMFENHRFGGVGNTQKENYLNSVSRTNFPFFKNFRKSPKLNPFQGLEMPKCNSVYFLGISSPKKGAIFEYFRKTKKHDHLDFL